MTIQLQYKVNTKTKPYQYAILMTKKQLEKLKKKLPPKYRETLAEKFEITTGYVDQILRGEKERLDVIDAAIELAEKHQQYLAEQKQKIRSL